MKTYSTTKYPRKLIDLSKVKFGISYKEVLAKPMSRKEYNDYRGWSPPLDGYDDKGYLVEYINSSKTNHSKHKGWITWSYIDVFLKEHKEA